MSSAELERAAGVLRAGGLVAFPTETVYGLGADASNPAAVARIFAAKGRPADHPLIVHLPDVSHLDAWAREIPAEAARLAAAFWPGPLTLILKRQPHVPDLVTGGQDTVGVRVPGHPLALELLKSFGGGIAAPSANRFGRISPTTAEHVREELGAAVDLVLDGGPCRVGIESTILDLSGGEPVVLRPGAIAAAELAAQLGRDVGQGGRPNAPRVSGSLDAHYAPTTAMRLVVPEHLESELQRSLAGGHRVAVLARRPAGQGSHPLHWRIAPSDAVGYAHELYANLRQLDHLAVDLILVEAPPEETGWFAVADRLARAARGSRA